MELELKNKFSIGAKRITYLMDKYYDCPKIQGYCKECPNYSKYWSCPPFVFDEAIFLKEYKYIHLIGRQFEIPREDIQNICHSDEIDAYCQEKLDITKAMTWKTLLEIEHDIPKTLGLIPGSCFICEARGIECSRKLNQPCHHKGLMRFSLESLGFNVVDLVKYEVGITIKWPESQCLPDVLTYVAAILTDEEIPENTLRKYFPDEKH